MRSLLALVPLVCLVSTARAQTAPPPQTQYLNEFGTRLWREVVNHEERGTGNRLVSPIANYLAWSMVLNGTHGGTRAELIKTLGLPVDELAVGRINGSNRACQDILISQTEGRELSPYLSISNGAWVSNQLHGGRPFEFSPDFTHSLEYFYGAEISPIDFSSLLAAPEINGWFNEKTKKLIPHVVDKDEVEKLMFLLANATYFKGSWAASFTEIRPQGGSKEFTDFHLADGTVSPRTMIRATDDFRHVADQTEELIELPFVSDSPADKEFVFYAALPNGSHDLAEYRSEKAWSRVVQKLEGSEPSEGHVTLPKFKFDYSYAAQANSPLAEALGLNHLFQNTADLSALRTPESAPAKIGLFKSVNRIELDEKGVKAAAAVVIGGVMVTSVRETGPRFDMRINRPFAFAIAEKVTGALVFVGEVANPN